MPRYLVERSFPGGLQIPATEEGARACLDVVARNAGLGVTWLHSYVSDDNLATYCVYDGPSPEAIRQAAACNGLPVDRITRVSVLDPYSIASRTQPVPSRARRGLARPGDRRGPRAETSHTRRSSPCAHEDGSSPCRSWP